MEVILMATLAAGLGIVLCLWGYRIFLVMLPIFGFFAGFWLGAEAVALIFGAGFLGTVTGWVVGFILGLVVAVLSYLFYIVGVALVALAAGAALGAGIMGAIGFDSGLLLLIVEIVSAVVVAGLTLVFNLQKYVIIAITALAGANAIVLSPLLLSGRVTLAGLSGAGSAIRPVLQDSWLWLIIWLIIAIGSIVYQVRRNRSYTFNRDVYVEGWG
jgi:hypothetical protein